MTAPDLLQRRRALLTAALGFAQLPPWGRALATLHGWLDTWREVGVVAIGMGRHGYDLMLEHRGARTWHASFSLEHANFSLAAPTGYASARTPWQAIQWAAWQAVQRWRPSWAAERS